FAPRRRLSDLAQRVRCARVPDILPDRNRFQTLVPILETFLSTWSRLANQLNTMDRSVSRTGTEPRVVKHSADSGCVGRPVAKCREAPLLFSAVNLRLQDPRARRCR